LKADLHIHSQESDGCLTVEEVLLTARERGIEILAITDHETTCGVEKAEKLASAYGIEIIPGVELSTVYREEEIHLLAYYRNIDNDQLQAKLLQLRQDKTETTRKMVKTLHRQGIALEWEEVAATASQGGLICKTHIMYAIRNKTLLTGSVNWNEIASWFRPGGMAYIPYTGYPFTEAVDFIFETGGLPVLAHPGLIRNQSLVKNLMHYKPIGLEVYYGYWDQQEARVAYYENLAKETALLATGGSDYHGFYSPVGIGQIVVPEACAGSLKDYLKIK